MSRQEEDVRDLDVTNGSPGVEIQGKEDGSITPGGRREFLIKSAGLLAAFAAAIALPRKLFGSSLSSGEVEEMAGRIAKVGVPGGLVRTLGCTPPYCGTALYSSEGGDCPPIYCHMGYCADTYDPNGIGGPYCTPTYCSSDHCSSGHEPVGCVDIHCPSDYGSGGGHCTFTHDPSCTTIHTSCATVHCTGGFDGCTAHFQSCPVAHSE